MFFTFNQVTVCVYVCVCMLGYIKIYFHCSGSSQVCLAHRSLLARDSNSARGKYLEMSHISPGHTHSAAGVRPFKSPAICQSISKYPMGIQCSDLTCKLCLDFYLHQPVPQSLQLHVAVVLIIFGKHPGNRALYEWGSKSGHKLTVPLDQGFSKESEMGQVLKMPG